MKTFRLLFWFCLFTQAISLQAQITVLTISAKVMDNETRNPVAYANVGFADRNIGTVSASDGSFELSFNEELIGRRDVFLLSAEGYQTLKVSQEQLMLFLRNTNVFYLKPDRSESSVPESIEPLTETRIGHALYLDDLVAAWQSKQALGAEMGTLIKIDNRKTQLLDLKFNVTENRSDSLLVRVNVYDYRGGTVGEKLAGSDILHTVKVKSGEVSIDLKPYGIIVDDDVIVTLELLQIFGSKFGFSVSAGRSKGISFYRSVSHGQWRRQAGEVVCFNMLVSESEQMEDDELNERPKPEAIALYWDTSLGMKDRNLEREIAFLEGYLSTLEAWKLNLVTFGYMGVKSQIFEKSDWEQLKNTLLSVVYDGASDYSKIVKPDTFREDVALLFTDGISAFSELKSEIDVPVFTVNSKFQANHFELQKIALLNEGHYINLDRYQYTKALEFIRYKLDDTDVYQPSNYSGMAEIEMLQGKVFNVAGPIQGALVRIQNTFIEVETDVDGYFSIPATLGDKLVISALGMERREMEVLQEDGMMVLLKPEGNLLDEVVLEGERKDEDVDTGYGKRSESATGFAVASITKADISPSYNTLADVITGRFAGVQVVGLNVAYNTPQFLIRGGGGSLTRAYAMFEIDGMVYAPDQEIPYIHPQDIESITLLKSISATNRYGTLGQGGAFIIKTRYMMPDEQSGERRSALVQGNDYTDTNVPDITNELIRTPYLDELRKAPTLEDAKITYLRQRELRQHRTIAYLLNVADFFRPLDESYAMMILSNIVVLANQNPKALKALAFKLESWEKWHQAAKIYEYILLIRPQHEQSYRDLALAYANSGRYQWSSEIYFRMLSNQLDKMEIKHLLQMASKEVKHLVTNHRSKLNYKMLPSDFLEAGYNIDLRIVFEWNDPEVEFELQFVNPNNKYYFWKHTLLEDPEKFKDQREQGCFSEEFLIDKAEPGQWIVNLNAYNVRNLENPTLLKYTVYANYGSPDEVSYTKVIELFDRKGKITIDTIDYQ